jgi:hypothetical protein
MYCLSSLGFHWEKGNIAVPRREAVVIIVHLAALTPRMSMS